jgi:hypothetical protein
MDNLASVRKERAENKTLIIRIPKREWNSYKPQAHAYTTRPTVNTKVAPKPDVDAVEGDIGSDKEHTPSGLEDEVAHPPARTKNCNIKLWNFGYGGRDRASKGALQNGITLEMPCLQPTCASCWKWHPRLMRNQGEDDTRPMQREQ